MKKITALISALALLTGLTTFPASAETAVPVEVDEAVYAILLDSYGCDDNKDGVVTEEEFRSVLSLRMNPCGFDDLSWMAGMESLTSLILEEGTLSDSAAQSLLQVPQIDSIQMYNVTLSSIDFLREMKLNFCRMQECTPFSDSELLSIMRVEDVTVQKGFAAKGGVFPEGLFSTNDLMLTIGDTDVACLDTYGTVQSPSSNSIFYGKEVGETTFTLSIYGRVEFTGKITVEDFTPEAIPLGETTEAPEILDAIHHGGGIGTALLKDGTMYSLNDGALQLEAENVESFHYAYIYDETGRNNHRDIVLYRDGSITVDGKPLQSDEEFVYAKNGSCVAGNGDLYEIREENGEFFADYLYTGFGSYDSKVGQCFFSDEGEVMFKAYMPKEGGGYRWEVFPMGITDVISAQGQYFVDKNHILWEVDREKDAAPVAAQIAENVECVGIYRYEEYPLASILYITTYGKAKLPSTHKEVTLCEIQLEEEKVMHYLDAANFSVWYTEDGKMMSDPSIGHDYHLSLDNVLTIDCRGVKTGITDVAQFVDNDYSGYGETVYAYFIRTDGSLWCYSSETNSYFEIPFTAPELLAGDANADGAVNVADAVLLQKYLLGKAELTSAQAKNAELCKDGSINGFDLAVLKRMLLA